MPDFSSLIRNWYNINKRDLPWRYVTDPYQIWVSEVILQQTRVAQGKDYYHNFLRTFPTIHDLARADETSVLRVWQGLGYYSRARNMHQTAKVISKEYNGIFPTSYKQLLALKGIGPYTAAAIASFCFGEAVAVADGNVHRVLSRHFEITEPIDISGTKKLLSAYAQEVLCEQSPGEHNQAIMELGALVCKPQRPACGECPVQETCMSYHNGTHLLLPRKSKQKKSVTRNFNYLVFLENDQIIITKRSKKDIWKHLYEFPLIESIDDFIEINELENRFGKIDDIVDLPPHLLTHQKIQSRFFLFNKSPKEWQPDWQSSHIDELHSFPFSVLILRFLESYLQPKIAFNT